MNFYKFWIGDFQRDTSHLSLAERGAYLALLNHFYATERALPNDLKALSRIVGVSTKADRAALERVLAEFFELTDEGFFNSRSRRELDSLNANRETAREVGKKGGRPRKTDTYETQRVIKGFPKKNPEQNLARLQTPDSREEGSPMCVSVVHTREQLDYAEFARVKANYPPNAGRTDWITAEHHIRRHLADGATWQDIHAGVERYGRLVAATNRMVLNPARFFGDRDNPWSQPWPLPLTRAQVAQDQNINAATAWLSEVQRAAG